MITVSDSRHKEKIQEAISPARYFSLNFFSVSISCIILSANPLFHSLYHTRVDVQRDVYAGKQSEIDGLIYEVVRMGQQYGVPVPTYSL